MLVQEFTGYTLLLSPNSRFLLGLPVLIMLLVVTIITLYRKAYGEQPLQLPSHPSLLHSSLQDRATSTSSTSGGAPPHIGLRFDDDSDDDYYDDDGREQQQQEQPATQPPTRGSSSCGSQLAGTLTRCSSSCCCLWWVFVGCMQRHLVVGRWRWLLLPLPPAWRWPRVAAGPA